MKNTKTVLLPLLNSNKKRIYKSDIKCVHSQKNIIGSCDTLVFTKSGQFFLTAFSYEEAMEKIYGKGELLNA